MKFLADLKKIVNSGQARAVVLTGNVYDLFFDGNKYVPLIDLLVTKTKLDAIPNQQKGITQITYQVNRPIEILSDASSAELAAIWRVFHSDDTKSFPERLGGSASDSVYGLELLRQLNECNRKAKVTQNNLLMIIESADMLIPESEMRSMSPHDRRRVAVVHDWFSDPDFVNGHDSVILLAESRSLIHHRIARLPQVLSVNIPLPDLEQRSHFIEWFVTGLKFKVETKNIAEQSAGLSIHALRQLLISGDVSSANISVKVEEYMISQLGEGVVEFKRPTYKMDKVRGFANLRKFIVNELIPGFQSDDDSCIAGVIFGGPIGGGKTFLGEAMAAELDMPVIVLKNIRSKWYGETDVIFERLERLLVSLYRSMIFVDEADTIFGNIQSDQDTERRLTGKIQAMMSNPALRSVVKWLLMTARPHLLSPDIRRPGRMDLIIPILDPEDDDLTDFLKWTFGELYNSDNRCAIKAAVNGYSPASFSLLRASLKNKKCKTIEEALAVADDIVLPDIADTREYQTLQAKLNCTRRSLLVDPQTSRSQFDDMRSQWKKKLLNLEKQGIR